MLKYLWENVPMPATYIEMHKKRWLRGQISDKANTVQ